MRAGKLSNQFFIDGLPSAYHRRWRWAFLRQQVLLGVKCQNYKWRYLCLVDTVHLCRQPQWLDQFVLLRQCLSPRIAHGCWLGIGQALLSSCRHSFSSLGAAIIILECSAGKINQSYRSSGPIFTNNSSAINAKVTSKFCNATSWTSWS